jgi:Cu/Ag efflux protein CusF
MTLRTIAAAVALVLGLGAASAAAAQAGKKEFQLKGKIEKVDAKTAKLTVNGDKVDGWMAAMTMDYKVDKAEVLKTLKAGDQIVAKVYEGNFDTLFDVQVVPPPDGKAPSPR